MVPVATQPTANAFVLLDGQVPTATLVSTSPVLKKYSSQKQYIRFEFSFCACLRISAYVCVYVCVSLRVLNFCQRLSSCMPSCRVVCMSVCLSTFDITACLSIYAICRLPTHISSNFCQSTHPLTCLVTNQSVCLCVYLYVSVIPLLVV